MRVLSLLTFEDRETVKARFFFFFFFFKSFIQTWLQGCCRLQGLPHTSGPLCSTQALLLVYIKLFFDGLFFIWLFMYILIRNAQIWIWIYHLCVLVKIVDLWFFDQYTGFWKWSLFLFFIGIIFIYQVLVFITAEINGFLNLGIHISIYYLFVCVKAILLNFYSLVNFF